MVLNLLAKTDQTTIIGLIWTHTTQWQKMSICKGVHIIGQKSNIRWWCKRVVVVSQYFSLTDYSHREEVYFHNAIMAMCEFTHA